MSIYDSERLARGYAFDRPPVHPLVVQRIAARLAAMAVRPRSALDVGCGAGRSTAALAAVASRVVGIEPVRRMLRHCREVAPTASFAVARAEQLPFADRSFDLITAAGSLNYADLDLFLPSAARVLTDRGVVVIYDFSAGRRLPADRRLDDWFAAFVRRLPFPTGYEMDVRGIPFDSVGLRLADYERFELAVPLDAQAYLAYVLSETNVELALSRGTAEEDIREWCAATLEPIFREGSRPVLFDGYVAYVTRQSARS